MELEAGMYHHVSATMLSEYSGDSPISRSQISVVFPPVWYFIEILELTEETVSGV